MFLSFNVLTFTTDIEHLDCTQDSLQHANQVTAVMKQHYQQQA